MVDARLFQALSDPTRLKILLLLSHSTMNVTSIVNEVGASQPAVSRHLRVLREASLINHVRNGKEIEYSLNLPQLRDARLYIEALTGGTGQGEGPRVVELAVPAAGAPAASGAVKRRGVASPERGSASAPRTGRATRARAARATGASGSAVNTGAARAKRPAARKVSEEPPEPERFTPAREYTVERDEAEGMDDFLL
jgi:DNA-binding transcriptional ArsR family regulator